MAGGSDEGDEHRVRWKANPGERNISTGGCPIRRLRKGEHIAYAAYAAVPLG